MGNLIAIILITSVLMVITVKVKTVYDDISSICLPKLAHCSDHHDCHHSQMCCRDTCCPKQYFEQWKKFSCVIDEQCVEWNTGQRCCSGGTCCDEHEHEDDDDGEESGYLIPEEEEYFTEPISSESKLSLEENERRSRHNDDDEKSVDEDLKHSKVATRQAVSSLALTN